MSCSSRRMWMVQPARLQLLPPLPPPTQQSSQLQRKHGMDIGMSAFEFCSLVWGAAAGCGVFRGEGCIFAQGC